MNPLSLTTAERPLGLCHHFRSAAASCEGHASFHAKNDDPRNAALWNALADVLYEQADLDEHDTPIGRRLLAVADLLNDLGDEDGPS